MQDFMQELVEEIRKREMSKKELNLLKHRLCRKYHLKRMPKDIEVFLNVKDRASIGNLRAKPVRTLSGVSVIALMTKPFPCPHGRCTFCPGGPKSFFGDVPQSYTGAEPSTRRSIRNGYDAYLTTMNRLEHYIAAGHMPDKVELIVQGGTFPAYPKLYQAEFVRDMYQALNDFSWLFFRPELDLERFKEVFELPSDIQNEERTRRIHEKLLRIKEERRVSLEEAKKENETASLRCIGLTIETKPDWGLLQHADQMLELGCTRVELGIQTTYDHVLRATNRGHSIEDSKKSIQVLRDLGFKLNFHIMPGLPQVTKEMDVDSFREYFENPAYRPDMLKVYPCMVMPGTKLFEDYRNGLFTPLTTLEAVNLVLELKRIVPEYCRIMRIQRDIPTNKTEAGVDRTNLRQYIEEAKEQQGIRCRCIRCREPRGRVIDASETEICVMEYEASGGKECFISAEAGDLLLGFCRMRFPSQCLREEITEKSALIRELHVYGAAVPIGKQGIIQHAGLGKRLLAAAEGIAAKAGKDKMVVISGVGVRKYYEKLGYRLEGPYMAKCL